MPGGGGLGGLKINNLLIPCDCRYAVEASHAEIIQFITVAIMQMKLNAKREAVGLSERIACGSSWHPWTTSRLLA